LIQIVKMPVRDNEKKITLVKGFGNKIDYIRFKLEKAFLISSLIMLLKSFC
jgi:hypothetical protein